MRQGPSWLDRLLGACLVVLASALALHWAWALVRPLLPVVVGAVVAGVVVIAAMRAVTRRREYW
jgi:formate/nitrite transporter FocA (FNT family)